MINSIIITVKHVLLGKSSQDIGQTVTEEGLLEMEFFDGCPVYLLCMEPRRSILFC